MPTFTCPGNYSLGYGSSRYRLSSGKATWQAGEADCEDDTAGQGSHLVVIDTSGEWDSVKLAAGITHGGDWWSIGVVRDAEAPNGPWRKVNGGDASFLPWRQTLGADEPTNSGSGEPVVVLDPSFNLTHSPSSGGYVDVGLADTFYYVCECDGLPPVDATPTP
jgi:hypothetical protein